MAKTVQLSMISNGVYRQVSPGISTDYGNSWSVGYDNTYAPALYYTYYAGFFASKNPLEGGSATLNISEIALEIELDDSGGTHYANVGIMGQSIDIYDKATRFDRIGGVTALWTLQTGRTHTLRITDAQQIKNVLAYGIGVTPNTTGNWESYVSVTAYYTYTDTAEPPTISITSYPSSAFLCDDIPLTWNYSQSADAAQSKVDIALFRDSTEFADQMLAEGVSLSGQSYTVSLRGTTVFNPELIPETEWKIGVRAYSASSSTPSAWAFTGNIKLKDVMAKLVSPIGGANRIASDPIDLVWGLKETPTGKPYAFLVSISTDGGETWKQTKILYGDAVKDGSNWKYTIAAGTLPHGAVRWYVVVHTTAVSFNPDSPRETFYAVVQASTSAVTCDGKPLPTLSWASTAQIAYQVRFADYDSGAVYGAAASHTVPYVYADGLYPVQVRTQATTGEWSAWTEVQYVQIRNTVPAGAVTVSANKTRHSVTLSWTVSGTFAGYILYRGGVPVYAGKDKQFADITANGKQTYFVRAVTAAGYYLQSAEITVDTTPEVDCMYDYESAQWISLKYSAALRRRQYTETERVSLRYFAGRAYPIAFTEGFRERTGAFSYCFRTEAEAASVAALSGKTVMYKGVDGSGIYGIVGSVSRVSELIHDVSFTVTQIDREERAAYETA